MEIVKSITDLEKDLKADKKKYDKLYKQLKKCKSSYQYETMLEDLEDCRQDITELQLMIQDLRRKEKREKEMNEIYVE